MCREVKNRFEIKNNSFTGLCNDIQKVCEESATAKDSLHKYIFRVDFSASNNGRSCFLVVLFRLHGRFETICCFSLNYSGWGIAV